MGEIINKLNNKSESTNYINNITKINKLKNKK